MQRALQKQTQTDCNQSARLFFASTDDKKKKKEKISISNKTIFTIEFYLIAASSRFKTGKWFFSIINLPFSTQLCISKVSFTAPPFFRGEGSGVGVSYLRQNVQRDSKSSPSSPFLSSGVHCVQHPKNLSNTTGFRASVGQP